MSQRHSNQHLTNHLSTDASYHLYRWPQTKCRRSKELRGTRMTKCLKRMFSSVKRLQYCTETGTVSFKSKAWEQTLFVISNSASMEWGLDILKHLSLPITDVTDWKTHAYGYSQHKCLIQHNTHVYCLFLKIGILKLITGWLGFYNLYKGNYLLFTRW